MLKVFDVAALATIDDGRVARLLESKIAQARLDVEDRPTNRGARKVSLEVILKPVADDHGRLLSVDVGFDVKLTVPKVQTPRFNMVPARGGLQFNDLSPDDAHQPTIDLVDPETGEIRKAAK